MKNGIKSLIFERGGYIERKSDRGISSRKEKEEHREIKGEEDIQRERERMRNMQRESDIGIQREKEGNMQRERARDKYVERKRKRNIV